MKANDKINYKTRRLSDIWLAEDELASNKTNK